MYVRGKVLMKVVGLYKEAHIREMPTAWFRCRSSADGVAHRTSSAFIWRTYGTLTIFTCIFSSTHIGSLRDGFANA